MYDPSKTYPLDEETQTMFGEPTMNTNMIPKKKKKYKSISCLTPEQQEIRRSKNREYSKNFRIKNPNYYNKKK
jgi:hypothetical protein